MMQRFSVLLLAFTFFGHAPGQPLAGAGATSFHAAARAARNDAGPFGVARVTAASKGVQFTPDGQAILITKDIAGARWAIALNADDTITGNVFRCDGGPASFLWCAKTDDDHNPDFPNRVAVWECFGADACVETPCIADEEWQLIDERIELKGSFFLP